MKSIPQMQFKIKEIARVLVGADIFI